MSNLNARRRKEINCPGVGKNFKSFCVPLLLPNKVCFGPKRYVSVVGDFLCHADIGKHIKYFYYDHNLVVMATARETFFFLRRLKNGINGLIYMDFQKNLSSSE